MVKAELRGSQCRLLPPFLAAWALVVLRKEATAKGAILRMIEVLPMVVAMATGV
jgi:hypothetical protein